MGLVEVEEWLLELGKLEEPALLLDALERAIAIRAERVRWIGRGLSSRHAVFLMVAHLRLGEVGFLRTAVPAIIRALVDITPVQQCLQELLHARNMARLRGANEVVVRNLERLPQIAEGGLHGVAPCLRRIEPVLLGRLGNLLAMFIHAGKEFDVLTACALETSLHVGKDGAVRRA